MSLSSTQYYNNANEHHCYSNTPAFDEFDAAVEEVLGDVDTCSFLGVQTINLDELMRLEPPLEFSMTESPYQLPQISQDMCTRTVLDNSTEFRAQVSSDEEDDSIQELPKPKRALSAYNMFFQSERKRILQSLPKDLVPCASKNRKGKKRRHPNALGFADMARLVASRWKTISKEERMEYDYLAAIDGERYEKEMAEWKRSTKA